VLKHDQIIPQDRSGHCIWGVDNEAVRAGEVS